MGTLRVSVKLGDEIEVPKNTIFFYILSSDFKEFKKMAKKTCSDTIKWGFSQKIHYVYDKNTSGYFQYNFAFVSDAEFFSIILLKFDSVTSTRVRFTEELFTVFNF